MDSKNLLNRSVSYYADFDAMKAGAVDIISELVRVCEEYIGARKGGLDDPNSRHGMVNLLLKSARSTLTQIAGMKEADFQSLYEENMKVLL